MSTTTDTVIVDPVMLRQCMESFRKISGNLAKHVTSLEGITAEITAAYTSDASESFQIKMKNLSQNWTNAKGDMDKKITELNTMTEKFEAVIKESKAKADALSSSFTMQ